MIRQSGKLQSRLLNLRSAVQIHLEPAPFRLKSAA